jgi:hypothetical protein
LGYTKDDVRKYHEAKQTEDKEAEDHLAPLAPLPASAVKRAGQPNLSRRVSVIERKLASQGKGAEGGADEACLDASDFEQYVAFVPRRTLPQLPAMAATKPSATMEKLEGVVSFLDLAGFTKLTERLAVQVI